MPTDVDTFVGKRVRRRRRLLGLTQHNLAVQIGVRYQQIQKYECGANRITASRLFAIATALSVNINYFFDGLAPDGTSTPANDVASDPEHDVFTEEKSLELTRSYCNLDGRQRRRLLDFAKALGGNEAEEIVA